ncbi:glycosyltransferase [bacterium]|nr:glycosyltransferase [bacterium]
MNREFKVVQIVPSISLGGAEQMALNLTRVLTEKGLDAQIVSLSGNSEVWNEVWRKRGLDYNAAYFVGKRQGPDFSCLRGLFRHLGQIRPRVVHSHMHALRYLVPCAVRQRQPRYFHTLHSIEKAHRSIAENVTHAVARSLNIHPIGVSRAVAKSYEGGGVYRHVPVIENGIDTGRFAFDPGARQETRSMLGARDGTVVYVCVARFHDVKNHLALIRGFLEVLEDGRDLMLVLVGDGPTRVEAENLVASREQSMRIRFLGAASDPCKLLAGGDFFVLASKWEGHPLALLEAMSVGLVPIVPRVGGIPEIVQDGENGILFEPSRSGELAGAIRASLQMSGRATMSKLARATIEKKFSSDAMGMHYLELYGGRAE